MIKLPFGGNHYMVAAVGSEPMPSKWVATITIKVKGTCLNTYICMLITVLHNEILQYN